MSFSSFDFDFLNEISPSKLVKTEINSKRSKDYYVKAAKKSRKKKREEELNLRQENYFYETEIPLLKRKITNLKEELDNLLDSKRSKTSETLDHQCLKRENQILSTELATLKRQTSNLNKFVQAVNETTKISKLLVNMNQNCNFMLQNIISVLQNPRLLERPCVTVDLHRLDVSELLKSFDKIPIENSGFLNFVNQYSSRSSQYSIPKFEIRTNEEAFKNNVDSERWCRIDLYDIDIPAAIMSQILVELERNCWFDHFFQALFDIKGSYSYNRVDVLKKKNIVLQGKVEEYLKQVQATVNFHTFDNINSNITHGMHIRTNINISSQAFPNDSNKDQETCEVFAKAIIPRKNSDLTLLDHYGYKAIKSNIIREGSIPNTCSLTLLTIFKKADKILGQRSNSENTEVYNDVMEMQNFIFMKALKDSFNLEKIASAVAFTVQCAQYLTKD